MLFTEDEIVLSRIPRQQLINEVSDDVIKKMTPILQAMITPKSKDILYTRKQLREIFHVSLVSIDAWTRTGKLKGYRIGARIYYKAEDVEAALSEIKTT